MSASSNPAHRGRANRRKGHDTERAVARYLNTVGFGGAQRAVRNTHPDPLDLTGIPGTVWSIKSVSGTPMIDKWLTEAEVACNQQGADLAVLVIRRAGKAQPARWWAWVSYGALTRAVTDLPWPGPNALVCFELGELVPLLRQAGYGDAVEIGSTA